MGVQQRRWELLSVRIHCEGRFHPKLCHFVIWGRHCVGQQHIHGHRHQTPCFDCDHQLKRAFSRNHYHGSQHHLGNHRRNQDLWLVKEFWAFFKFTTGSKCNLTSPLLLTTPILDRTSLEVLIDAIIHHLGPLNSFNPLLCHKSVIIITVIVIVFRMRWVVIWHSIELI